MAYFGHDDVLEFLLEEIKKNELPVDVIDNMGYTPLLYGKLSTSSYESTIVK